MTKAMKIAIVDDEKDMRQSISQWLALSGYDTEAFGSAEEALGALGTDYPGIVISDIKMPGMDGIQFLKKLMGADSALPVIMITGHGDVPMAVEAMRIGAFDFLEKPFNPDRMSELAKKATNARRLTLDNRALRSELAGGEQIMNKFIGDSPAMHRLREDILDVNVPLGATVVRRQLKLRDILNMQPGDVIPVEMPEDMIMRANGMPAFKVKLGAHKGNLALQVLEPVVRPR